MPALLSLLSVDVELYRRVAARVAAWRLPPASLVVYGSVARGETTPASDIDVLVVRPDRAEPDDATWESQLADLADHLSRWTGRRASLVDMSQHELVQGLAAGEPFLVGAARDGWRVAGQPLTKLTGGQS